MEQFVRAFGDEVDHLQVTGSAGPLSENQQMDGSVSLFVPRQTAWECISSRGHDQD